MPVELELIVPEIGESIKEVQVGRWHKQPGQAVAKDESVVELESDKATVDLPAPGGGVISKVLKSSGETAAVGEVIGYMSVQGAGDRGAAAESGVRSQGTEKKQPPAAAGGSQGSEPKEPPAAASRTPNLEKRESRSSDGPSTPSCRRPSDFWPNTILRPTARRRRPAPGGRLLKEDVQRAVEQSAALPQSLSAKDFDALAPPASSLQPPAFLTRARARTASPRFRRSVRGEEEFVVMSPIRRRIAQRLVEAQQTAALLTTFNEVDMTEVMALRQKHKELYQQRYGVKLGFMSFFVKASIDALKLVPQVNAEVRHDPHVVYRNYYDIGIAVGGGKGLVVPVLRNAEYMSFAEIEQAIADFAAVRPPRYKLKLEELQGGTFTISNGGVYGSLLSTPIVNPPQSGILGLHAIQDRPMAIKGQVVIRPMMYVALTYDHRIVDGREAVTFLKCIKDTIEDPRRILLEV